jgi:hypothetical protein
MVKKDKNAPAPFAGNTWILAGIVVIILILAVIAILLATGSTGSGSPGGADTVPANECGATVMKYANANLISKDSPATLTSVNDRYGMYYIEAQNSARSFGFYASKDCILLFINPYKLNADYTQVATSPKPTTSPTPIPLPVKSARPSVELFVMSYCPFGVQAETAMAPVIDLLGKKADIRVRYIVTVNGNTVDSIKSLHGLVEAKEDLRQLCIAKYYPESLWPYLSDYNKNCQTTLKDAASAAACGANATAKLGIDNQKIEACASGSEGIGLLKADEAITTSLRITGSPTLMMNGQKYAGQRTADAYLQGICDRFEAPPAECGTNLSAQTAPASSGSC